MSLPPAHPDTSLSRRQQQQRQLSSSNVNQANNVNTNVDDVFNEPLSAPNDTHDVGSDDNQPTHLTDTISNDNKSNSPNTVNADTSPHRRSRLLGRFWSRSRSLSGDRRTVPQSRSHRQLTDTLDTRTSIESLHDDAEVYPHSASVSALPSPATTTRGAPLPPTSTGTDIESRKRVKKSTSQPSDDNLHIDTGGARRHDVSISIDPEVNDSGGNAVASSTSAASTPRRRVNKETATLLFDQPADVGATRFQHHDTIPEHNLCFDQEHGVDITHHIAHAALPSSSASATSKPSSPRLLSLGPRMVSATPIHTHHNEAVLPAESTSIHPATIARQFSDTNKDSNIPDTHTHTHPQAQLTPQRQSSTIDAYTIFKLYDSYLATARNVNECKRLWLACCQAYGFPSIVNINNDVDRSRGADTDTALNKANAETEAAETVEDTDRQVLDRHHAPTAAAAAEAAPEDARDSQDTVNATAQQPDKRATPSCSSSTPPSASAAAAASADDEKISDLRDIVKQTEAANYKPLSSSSGSTNALASHERYLEHQRQRKEERTSNHRYHDRDRDDSDDDGDRRKHIDITDTQSLDKPIDVSSINKCTADDTDVGQSRKKYEKENSVYERATFDPQVQTWRGEKPQLRSYTSTRNNAYDLQLLDPTRTDNADVALMRQQKSFGLYSGGSVSKLNDAFDPSLQTWKGPHPTVELDQLMDWDEIVYDDEIDQARHRRVDKTWALLRGHFRYYWRLFRRDFSNPDSYSHRIWCAIIVLTVCYFAVMTPVMAFYPSADKDVTWLYALDIVLDILFILDIVKTLSTGYDLDDAAVFSFKRNLKRYASNGTLFFDLLSISYFPMIFYPQNNFTRGWALTRLGRLYKVPLYIRHIVAGNTYSPVFQIFRVGKYIVGVLIACHTMACIWIFMAFIQIEAGASCTWMSECGYMGGLVDWTPAQQYIVAFDFAITTMTSVGYGDIIPKSDAERLFTILWELIGAFYFAFLIGNIAVVFAYFDSSKLNFQSKLRAVTSYLRYRGIGDELQRRVVSYFQYGYSQRQYYPFADNDLLNDLSASLKREVLLHTNYPLLTNIPLLRDADPHFLRKLMVRMKPLIITPHDLIVIEGDVARTAYFILSGSVEVYSHETQRRYLILSRGDFFGEYSLFVPSIRTASVRALTHCDMVSLSASDVDDVCKLYPQEGGRLKQRAIEARAAMMQSAFTSTHDTFTRAGSSDPHRQEEEQHQQQSQQPNFNDPDEETDQVK